ncbi:MAG TPA: efflux RND transporter periplasmic adaptor subunit [Polyangiaceae bacterium]|nr:efflux RND transporter periplasmic adaptor subunit [Polyangiaceae bacterium]
MTEPPPAAALRIDASGITLPSDAPQWKVVHRGKATPLTERWSDAYPARFKVDEAQASRVGAPLAGRVASCFVEVGQHVKAGDPLVAISSADVADLRSQRQKAQVDLDVARAKEARIAAMVDARAVPGSEGLNAEHELKAAELALALADTKLASLRVSAAGLNTFTVLAPRDGVVIEKNVLPGQQVSTDGTLFSVADLSTVWVVAELFETDASVVVSKGATARITSPSLPGRALEAPVEQISSVANPLGHTVSVRIPVANTESTLRPNAYAEVRFRTPPPTGAVEISASSVVSDGEKQYVYVQQGEGHFVRREVISGAVREGRVEVLRGLSAGDVVVEEGSALVDNQIAIAS